MEEKFLQFIGPNFEQSDDYKVLLGQCNRNRDQRYADTSWEKVDLNMVTSMLIQMIDKDTFKDDFDIDTRHDNYLKLKQ